MDPIVARKMWRTLEPVHGLVYFAPEPRERYEQLGLDGRDGYFASRSAAMGAVGPEVVITTFFNFNPALVRQAIPSAWERTTPAAVLDARLAGADAALRRALGDDVVESSEMAGAAEVARRAALACRPDGRPLHAAHAALPWPDEPHLVLWQAIAVLREHRGDGHVSLLVTAGVDGPEALVLHAATGDVPAAVLQQTRGWSDGDWAAAVERLTSRGWVDKDGAFTDEGRARRDEIEARTDELSVPPWQTLGEEACAALRATVRPWSRAIVDSGALAGR